MQQRKAHLTKEETRRYTVTFWKIVLGCIAFGIILIFSVGLGLFGTLPSFRDLENPKSNLASDVISDDGVVLGSYFVQNRSNVRYDQISPNVINALIATEDVRYYSHSGIDFKRTFTIIFYNLIGKKQGASTITQQLALNLFQEEGRAHNVFKRFIQKLQEWIIAIKLERNYTKEEIITMYLNTVDFGSYNSFGIKAASQTYFNTTPDKLKPEQAAVLVGMLKGPSFFSPVRNPERSLARRNTVLENMRKAGYLSDPEAEELKQTPLVLKFRPINHNEGYAAYFRAVLKKDIQKIFEEQNIKKADDTPYDLDRDGLKIYTTINSHMQKYAEEAQSEYIRTLQTQFNRVWKGRNPFKGEAEILLEQGMKRSDRYKSLKDEGLTEGDILKAFNTPVKMNVFSWKGNIDTVMTPMDSIKYYKLMLRNALVSIEAGDSPSVGYVRAWVGGINFEHFKYDQVKMGTRQVGSTAKPFTYAVAIENQGFSPCYQAPNEPVTIDGWTPRAYKPIPGYITLKTALAYSQNYVTAYMMKQVGPTAVVTLLKKMGINSPNLDPYPAICLGTFDASLLDMTGAYSTFVNHGVLNEPIYLLRIEDKNGTVIYERKPKVTVALNEQTAYAMTDMLKGVVQRGTGRRIQYKYRLTNPIGGKTGTTQNNSDGWFIGITPQLVTGVWTGAEDRAIHFLSTSQGEGANSALPVFALYMKKVYADPTLKYTKGDFPTPKGGMSITLNCDAYVPKSVTDSAGVPATEPNP
ncbi:transglycosylase domain-containing protein [Arcticibacter tournemirensis]|uniref:Penicillin-binding protein n=1 Tax=Arcticibacter tournemirensis TaxID=699437 RepID=A0A4Q0M396_9SPHI|nr:transglycosylase domain-containing protein [Arcticibacter tournemirensis]RXF67139.1 penicillin-binding protein [Arcticibacter tournemirensis]